MPNIYDDYEQARDRARQLLRDIVPEHSWAELEDKGVITHTGKKGTYVISSYGETEIRGPYSGRCLAYACLKLSIPAPTYDRMVAEYLLIKNAEDVYWKTANLFRLNRNDFVALELITALFNCILFINLLLEVIGR